jgi:transcriptional regulator with XRE-family HTH domain
LSLKEFLDVLNRVAGHETGWPPWWLPSRPEIAPYPKDEMIECWLKETTFKDPAHADYWLADPKGRMFLVRGYQEDSTDKFLPGTVFDLTLPVWRVAECLLHAKRLAIELGGEQARVDVAFEWGGLKGRTLTAWAEPMRMLFEGRSAKQDSVRTSIVAVAADINPATLPTLVSELTIPLYNIFDFFEPQRSLFVEEIEKMLGRK